MMDALAAAGPGRHDAAAANEVAELWHDALRPWRRRIKTGHIVRAIEYVRSFQFVENKETIDVRAIGAKYADGKKSLCRHALSGVLSRQPVPVVGQDLWFDVAPDRQKTRTAHLDLSLKRLLSFAARPKPVQRRRNRARQFSQPLHDGQNCGDISVWTEAADHGGGSA